MRVTAVCSPHLITRSVLLLSGNDRAVIEALLTCHRGDEKDLAVPIILHHRQRGHSTTRNPALRSFAGADDMRVRPLVARRRLGPVYIVKFAQPDKAAPSSWAM